MQDACANRYDAFDQVLACTKNKLYNDPLAPTLNSDAADTNEIVAYGDDLSSQVRQQLITNAQAKESFAKKIAEVKARHDPAPLPLQQGLH